MAWAMPGGSRALPLPQTDASAVLWRVLEKLFDREPNYLDAQRIVSVVRRPAHPSAFAALDKRCPDGDHRHDESGQVVELDELLPSAVGGFAGGVGDV